MGDKKEKMVLVVMENNKQEFLPKLNQVPT